MNKIKNYLSFRCEVLGKVLITQEKYNSFSEPKHLPDSGLQLPLP